MQKVIELERAINEHRAAMKGRNVEARATYKTLTGNGDGTEAEQFKTEQKAREQEDREVFKRLQSELFALYDVGTRDFDTPSREGMKSDTDTPFDYFTFAKTTGAWEHLKTDAGTIE